LKININCLISLGKISNGSEITMYKRQESKMKQAKCWSSSKFDNYYLCWQPKQNNQNPEMHELNPKGLLPSKSLSKDQAIKGVIPSDGEWAPS